MLSSNSSQIQNFYELQSSISAKNWLCMQSWVIHRNSRPRAKIEFYSIESLLKNKKALPLKKGQGIFVLRFHPSSANPH